LSKGGLEERSGSAVAASFEARRVRVEHLILETFAWLKRRCVLRYAALPDRYSA
jgi:hypothetical protein